MTLRRCLASLALIVAGVATVEARAATQVLIVSGLGGEDHYQESFDSQAEVLKNAAPNGAHVVLLKGKQATARGVREGLRSLAGKASSQDVLLVQIIGHGSFDGAQYKLNLPGADASGEQLRDWLAGVPHARQIVVLATPSSGAVAKLLERKGRTVITATRSGQERNATVFGGYWAAAQIREEADTDKDLRVSLREAFAYASAATDEHYQRDGVITTEHPQMLGDGLDGFSLAVLDDRDERRVPASLLARRETLEQSIAELRDRKAQLPIGEYQSQLEALLLELAGIEVQIDSDSSQEKP